MCVRVGGRVHAREGCDFSNSIRIIPSDYRILHLLKMPIPSLYYHACLHYVNKKGYDKDTDCTCCVDCILKWFTSLKSHESQLSVDI